MHLFGRSYEVMTKPNIHEPRTDEVVSWKNTTSHVSRCIVDRDELARGAVITSVVFYLVASLNSRQDYSNLT